MFRTLPAAASVALAVLWGSAGATPLDNNFGLANPETVIGFDDLGNQFGDGHPVTDQYQAQGVVFSGTPAGPLVTLFSDFFVNMDGYALNQGGGAYRIQFQGTVTEAAFALMTNQSLPNETIVRALLDDTEVESYATTTNLTGRYLGFTDIVFDTIEVLPGGQNGAFRMDNLQFGALARVEAPEPATLVLLALGLAGLGLRGRRASR